MSECGDGTTVKSDLEKRMEAEIEARKFNVLEMQGFRSVPKLALVAGCAIGYRQALKDYESALAFDTPENRALVERIKGGVSVEIRKRDGEWPELLNRSTQARELWSLHVGGRIIANGPTVEECVRKAASDYPAAAQKWNGEG